MQAETLRPLKFWFAALQAVKVQLWKAQTTHCLIQWLANLRVPSDLWAQKRFSIWLGISGHAGNYRSEHFAASMLQHLTRDHVSIFSCCVINNFAIFLVLLAICLLYFWFWWLSFCYLLVLLAIFLLSSEIGCVSVCYLFIVNKYLFGILNGPGLFYRTPKYRAPGPI